jgi:hypothetical protein
MVREAAPDGGDTQSLAIGHKHNVQKELTFKGINFKSKNLKVIAERVENGSSLCYLGTPCL